MAAPDQAALTSRKHLLAAAADDTSAATVKGSGGASIRNHDAAPTKDRRASLAKANDETTSAGKHGRKGETGASLPTGEGRRTLLAQADGENSPVRLKHGRNGASDDNATPTVNGRYPAFTKANVHDDALKHGKHGRHDMDESDDSGSKTSAGKRALAAKHEPEPQRYWVQVAGGANDASLGKAWSIAQSKAPALAGKRGYTTPLRATNRVLAGPFKTDDEARAFVNTLNKQGVHAFQFTSDKGQKIRKLDDE